MLLVMAFYAGKSTTAMVHAAISSIVMVDSCCQCFDRCFGGESAPLSRMTAFAAYHGSLSGFAARAVATAARSDGTLAMM